MALPKLGHMTWVQAKPFVNESGNLVTLSSTVEQNFIYQHAATSIWWIGLQTMYPKVKGMVIGEPVAIELEWR
jgi:hypothetical protein